MQHNVPLATSFLPNRNIVLSVNNRISPKFMYCCVGAKQRRQIVLGVSLELHKCVVQSKQIRVACNSDLPVVDGFLYVNVGSNCVTLFSPYNSISGSSRIF